MSITKKTNTGTFLKVKDQGHLTRAIRPTTSKYVSTSTAAQSIIILDFAVEQANLDNFILIVDGVTLNEGASADFVFYDVSSGQSNKIQLNSPLVAGLPIQAIYFGVFNSVLNASNLQAQINELPILTKYQVKKLSSNLTSSGAVSDLTFNNLEVGKQYRLVFHAFGDHNGVAGSVNIGLSYTNGATPVGRCFNKDTSGQEEWSNEISTVFIAGNATLTATLTRVGGRLLGDGTLNNTYAILEELPNHEVTTDWT